MRRVAANNRCGGVHTVIAALGAVAVLCGCGGGLDLVPVQGKVTLDGKPLTKGHVLTQPAAGRGSNGNIQSDGTFTLSSGREAGALVGTHAVAVVAYENETALGAESDFGKLLVPKKYTNFQTSMLSIEVKADDDNEPVLELVSR
jgi:hypothetical protein